MGKSKGEEGVVVAEWICGVECGMRCESFFDHTVRVEKGDCVLEWLLGAP